MSRKVLKAQLRTGMRSCPMGFNRRRRSVRSKRAKAWLHAFLDSFCPEVAPESFNIKASTRRWPANDAHEGCEGVGTNSIQEPTALHTGGRLQKGLRSQEPKVAEATVPTPPQGVVEKVSCGPIVEGGLLSRASTMATLGPAYAINAVSQVRLHKLRPCVQTKDAAGLSGRSPQGPNNVANSRTECDSYALGTVFGKAVNDEAAPSATDARKGPDITPHAVCSKCLLQSVRDKSSESALRKRCVSTAFGGRSYGACPHDEPAWKRRSSTCAVVQRKLWAQGAIIGVLASTMLHLCLVFVPPLGRQASLQSLVLFHGAWQCVRVFILLGGACIRS